MMQFISFTSGSCGNCCYIGNGSEGLLIDAGASMRAVKRAMADRGLDIRSVKAILVTHDHLDHIRFLGTYCKYLMPRVYTTRKLHGALSVHSFTKDHIAACRGILEPDKWNDVCGFSVRYFIVPHDATQTVGFAVNCAGERIVMMTDLEHVTPEAMELAKLATTVIIESNYDTEMLAGGPYPPELKERILKEGHLSNGKCAEAIKEFYHPGLRNLFLCHLSGNNNTPKLAYESALHALETLGIEKGTIHLRTLERGVAGPLIEL